ncbi:hypothetical protein H70357_11055 [Paenibacillus sp. FSL H7-0357]|uniref:hypothetical protein n=1 Tax=Paenibacillus sp. FSL H7-0357 TaxID=1536774 RepID=UPI0004F8C46A|nr:hypothetical protein [Paenibacillus sp. FSL H7-0357]AIQ17138.1 hypothetical protein H70357_11055 [Paenibacillus sp. FSL H7-0357]
MGTVKLVIIGGPALVIVLVFIVLLIKGWNPSSLIANAFLVSGIVILFYLSISLFQNTNIEGWLTEGIKSDDLKITTDQKYEYRLDLINMFQKNSHARLHVRNALSDEVKDIDVEISTRTIVVYTKKSYGTHWGYLEPTNEPDRYILNTTEDLGIPEEKFEVDIATGTSKRLE